MIAQRVNFVKFSDRGDTVGGIRFPSVDSGPPVSGWLRQADSGLPLWMYPFVRYYPALSSGVFHPLTVLHRVHGPVTSSDS
jgi:hypothetical protein